MRNLEHVDNARVLHFDNCLQMFLDEFLLDNGNNSPLGRRVKIVLGALALLGDSLLDFFDVDTGRILAQHILRFHLRKYHVSVENWTRVSKKCTHMSKKNSSVENWR